jgi:hypothetical protein
MIQGERWFRDFGARPSCANMNISPRSRISQKILEDPRAHRTLFFRQEKIFQDHWRDGRLFCGESA